MSSTGDGMSYVGLGAVDVFQPSPPPPPPPGTEYKSSLTLSDGPPNNTYSMDVSGDYLYIGLVTTPGKILKVQISTLAEVGSLTLGAGEDNIDSICIYGSTLYCGLDDGRIARVDLDTFTEFGSLLNLADPVQALYVAAGYLYACLAISPPTDNLIKLDMSTFSVVGSLSVIDAGYTVLGPNALVHSGNTLYGACGDSADKFVRIDLSTFTQISDNCLSMISELGEQGPYGIFLVSGELYCGGLNSRLVKVDLNSFSRVDGKTISEDTLAPCGSMATKGSYLYVGTGDYPARVARISLSSFKKVNTLEMASGEDEAVCMKIIGDYLYFVTVNVPAILIRILLSA